MLIHLGVTHIRATPVRHPGAVTPLMRRRITVDGKRKTNTEQLEVPGYY